MPGTGEMFKKLCKNKGIQVHFKGTNTLMTLLGNPKNKDPKNSQTGIIYHYKCPQINCLSAYIGESGRSLGERVKEHFKAPCMCTGPNPQQESGEIPTLAHMGPPATSISHTAVQVIQPSSTPTPT